MAEEMDDARKVHVTPPQADAAKLIIELDTARGKEPTAAIRKIAEAQAGKSPYEIDNPPYGIKDEPPSNVNITAFLSYIVTSPKRSGILLIILLGIAGIIVAFVILALTVVAASPDFRLAGKVGIGATGALIISGSSWAIRARAIRRHRDSRPER
jgi:hypothetical protein